MRQAAADLLYGLFESESLLECIGLYEITGKLELHWCRTGFAQRALQSAIGPIIAKFGSNIIFYHHEEGDLGFIQTEDRLIWLEPVATSHILAFMLPVNSNAVFLTENLKNTSRSLRYLLDKRRQMKL